MKYRGLLLIIGIFAVLMLVNAGRVHAFDSFSKGEVCTGEKADSSVCSTTSSNPISGADGIVIKVVRLLLIAVGVAAVIAIILGGLQYMISAGDPSKVSTAKDTILYAIIGLAVSLLGQAIIAFVLRRIL